MSDKKAAHPNGTHFVRFREQNHTYIDNFGVKYTSGTTFLKKYAPRFDAIAVSKKCAEGTNPKYMGRRPDDIRAEWAAEGQRGRNEGNNIHEYAESVMGPWCKGYSPALIYVSRIKPISERCEKIFRKIDFVHDQLREKGFVVLGVEMIIFSPELKIAGTIDLLLYRPATCEMVLADWKNNKNPLTTENIYQSYRKPIDHLKDTDISKFALQLSSYQYIFEKEKYFSDLQVNKFRRVVIHVGEDFAKTVQLEYYEYEIQELLKHEKRI